MFLKTEGVLNATAWNKKCQKCDLKCHKFILCNAEVFDKVQRTKLDQVTVSKQTIASNFPCFSPALTQHGCVVFLALKTVMFCSVWMPHNRSWLLNPLSSFLFTARFHPIVVCLAFTPFSVIFPSIFFWKTQFCLFTYTSLKRKGEMWVTNYREYVVHFCQICMTEELEAQFIGLSHFRIRLFPQ